MSGTSPAGLVDRIRCHLVGLKMPRALEVLDHVLRRLECGEIGAPEALEALLGEELTLREGRRLRAALKMGRLLTLKTLTGFDFSFQPSLDRNRILTLALVVTPNLPEAEVLADMRVTEPEDMEEAARRIHLMGPRYVLVKGGHLKGDATDLLWNGKEFTRFTAPRVDSTNTHGTGCTFSAAIAAGLARGQALGDAIRAAKAYVTLAIREGFKAGRGVGQLRHFVTDW